MRTIEELLALGSVLAFSPINGVLSSLLTVVSLDLGRQHWQCGLAGFFLTKRQYPNKNSTVVGREVPGKQDNNYSRRQGHIAMHLPSTVSQEMMNPTDCLRMGMPSSPPSVPTLQKK